MAGYSETPLIKKLGIKPNDKLKVVGEPEGYWDWVGPLPEGISSRGTNGFDFIHFFVQQRRLFEKQLPVLAKKMSTDGMIWVSWPKKSAKIDTDIDENVIRNFALKNKLVDVKVCAVSEVWSGLKLVIPLKLRR